MKTIELTPGMIGRRVTIRDADRYVHGRLNDLTVRTVDARTMSDPYLRDLLGITVQIGGDHIELTGSEDLEVAE